MDDRDLAHWWVVYRWVADRDEQAGAASWVALLLALRAAADDPVRRALVALALERGRMSEERGDDA